MPTYQYACTACGEQLEAVQSFTDPALTECPQCGGSLRKVFSAVGVVFKGSGFYRTDSRAGSSASVPAGSVLAVNVSIQVHHILQLVRFKRNGLAAQHRQVGDSGDFFPFYRFCRTMA